MWKWSRTLLVIGSAVLLALCIGTGPSLAQEGFWKKIQDWGTMFWGVRRLRHIRCAIRRPVSGKEYILIFCASWRTSWVKGSSRRYEMRQFLAGLMADKWDIAPALSRSGSVWSSTIPSRRIVIRSRLCSIKISQN